MSFSPRTGACRCGNLEMEVSAPPFMTMACHCRGCQRMTSSAFSLSAMVPAQAFRVSRGCPVQGGLRGAEVEHLFCPDCMTWVFTRMPGNAEFVNVRPTLFDSPDWAVPFVESWTGSKLAWVNLPVRHSFEGFPPPERYGALIAEFAEERG